MSIKVIVSNDSVLKRKYGTAGYKKIQAAIQNLIAADGKRGLQSIYLALDSATTAKQLKVAPVTRPEDPKQNKTMIDAIYRNYTPDYLVIFGATDVVPHQDLSNPLFAVEKNDTDQITYSDLPYACDAPYSNQIGQFIGPTRVVGRIPDYPDANILDYPIKLLNTAAEWTSRIKPGYSDYFGLSAKIWADSTAESLHNTFGTSGQLQLSPPKGPAWSNTELSRLFHFINCHGSPADPKYYGQAMKDENIKVIAHHTPYLQQGTISTGTVVSAECCYGAQLYNPTYASYPGICSTYLDRGAYGFFGSTTIAYGPPSGNSSADLICQYFLQYVRQGASLGRAVLAARQKFIGGSPAIGPHVLKTVAQFYLLGDPSIHPVSAPLSEIPFGGAPRGLMADANRGTRRVRMAMRGQELRKTVRIAKEVKKPTVAPKILKDLKAIAKKESIKLETFKTFAAQPSKKIGMIGLNARAEEAITFHVFGEDRSGKEQGIRDIILIVAREEAGKIVAYECLYSK